MLIWSPLESFNTSLIRLFWWFRRFLKSSNSLSDGTIVLLCSRIICISRVFFTIDIALKSRASFLWARTTSSSSRGTEFSVLPSFPFLFGSNLSRWNVECSPPNSLKTYSAILYSAIDAVTLLTNFSCRLSCPASMAVILLFISSPFFSISFVEFLLDSWLLILDSTDTIGFKLQLSNYYTLMASTSLCNATKKNFAPRADLICILVRVWEGGE